MRFLIDEKSYQEMVSRSDHPDDCYVRPGEYLHHMYLDGIRFVIARAVVEGLKAAEEKKDREATLHLALHKKQLDALLAQQKKSGNLGRNRMIGDPLPKPDISSAETSHIDLPPAPRTLADTGLSRSFIFELILRTIYNLGRPTGNEISRVLGLPYSVLGGLLQEMRQKDLLDIAGQSGVGEMNYEYILKPPRGHQAVEDALDKSEYFGPAPVPFSSYLAAVEAQSIRSMHVTRQNIRKAFDDLVLTESILNAVGPAINSADSIFLFGYAGNGKTSIAERITRLLGDEIYIPYAIEADGQIINYFDPIVHDRTHPAQEDDLIDFDNPFATAGSESNFDRRWLKVKRPTIIVGGELTLSMLDLAYNRYGKFYEAPLQMKANNGIFMIDDFGRQLVRPLDLLNRWIVPLEKRYDYLSTIVGNKLQIPFDVLLIFSTNLDPHQLADEAFLRRIKYKIEVQDPDINQWRQIWELVCRQNKIPLDQEGLKYLLERWYRPFNRPLRMCQPRDILNHMVSIAAYNSERVAFTPDLIDAACRSYFIAEQQQEFAKTVRLS
jgi:predicted ATPase with chaperone activity